MGRNFPAFLHFKMHRKINLRGAGAALKTDGFLTGLGFDYSIFHHFYSSTLCVPMHFSATYWHGVRSRNVHGQLCSGAACLALQEDFASDPGDLGWGIYLTKLKREARLYGHVIKVAVVLNNAVDLRAKGSGLAWFNRMSLFTGGNPVRGSSEKLERATVEDGYRYTNAEKWQDRIYYAKLWRELCLKDGIDGLVVKGWDLSDTAVVFEPEKSLKIVP